MTKIKENGETLEFVCPIDPDCDKFTIVDGDWYCSTHNKPIFPNMSIEEFKSRFPELYEVRKAYGEFDKHYPLKYLKISKKRKKKTLEDFFT